MIIAITKFSLQYSLTRLPPKSRLRRVPASVVRAQVAAIPLGVVARQGPGPQGGYEGYPHTFKNHEKLPLELDPNNGIIEHPLTPRDPYVPGDPPGPARIFVNERDRSRFEVGYHDPTKPKPEGSKCHPFSLANLRPGSGERDGARTAGDVGGDEEGQ